MAREMGDPLMWWQRIVADVALEINPETGLFAYREVVISLMRQQGKTHLILCTICARSLLWGEPQRSIYTMQDGHNARIKVKEELLPNLEASPIWPFVRRPYLSDGNTNILFENGSRMSVVSNSKASGEGRSGIDMLVLDEAHADKDDNRERALSPTTATKRNAQIWTPSTPGDGESVLFKRKVDAGRAGVLAGDTTGMCYFEFGVAADEDPYDFAVLERRVPAYDVLVHREYLEAEQKKPEALYRRNVAGQWVEVEERLIPDEYWLAACNPGVRAEATCYAIDAKPDRSSACIVKADSGGNVELVLSQRGVDWITSAFESDAKKLPVVVEKTGPAAVAADDLERSGWQIIRMDSLSARKASGRFYDAVMDKRIRIRSDERLDEAVKYAHKKTTADSWAWHRETPGGELMMGVSLAFSHAAEGDWQPLISSI